MSFNLADVLKNVSEPDTGHEQIQYIPLSLIDSDENNFYQLTGVEDLAANIATVGLQQPIRVRVSPCDSSRYLTVSGHRRRAALALLENDDPEKWGEVPCIVETDPVSPALQQLRLIYANANTRVMTSAEISEQAAQVEKLLYQLKEEGYEFPGRMRDHVAQAVGASKTKLARLKVIRDNLIFEWEPLYKANTIGESVAYALAGSPDEWQRIIYLNWKDRPKCLYETSVKAFTSRFAKIDTLHCYQCGCKCLNAQAMMIRSSKDAYSVGYCTGCCLSCYNLRSCSSCCGKALPEKKRLREAEKATTAEAKRREAERVAAKLERIRGIYKRIGQARAAAGVSAAQFLDVTGTSCSPSVVRRQEESEVHPETITNEHTSIFGYRINASDVFVLLKAADLLNVSLDWLLGRETSQTPKVSGSDTWQTGNPPTGGVYAVVLAIKATGGTTVEEAEWDGEQWHIWGAPLDADELMVTHWAKFPQLTPSPLNNSCKTGMSPSGHCGAAAYCGNDASCCLNCEEPCNSRCGWIEEDESNGQSPDK